MILLIIEVAAHALAIASLWRQNWFGHEDFPTFAAYTQIFATLFSVLALLAGQRQRGLGTLKRIAVATLTAGASALALSLAVTLLVGPWTRIFTFSPVLCWTAAGTAAFFAASLPSSGWTSRTWVRRRRIAKWGFTGLWLALAALWLLTPNWELWIAGGHYMCRLSARVLILDRFEASQPERPFQVYPLLTGSPIASSRLLWGWSAWWREAAQWPGASNGYVARGNQLVLYGTSYYLPVWIPLALLLIPTVLLWLADIRRPGPGHCQSCGYNLTGNTSGRCPECGTPVAATSGATPEPPMSASGNQL
jgi:hypothetical protein